MRAETHRDLYSGRNVAVLNAQNHRWGLEPMETSNSDADHAVFLAQNDRWGPAHIEICNSAPIVAVLHAKKIDKGWDPKRQVILVLITLYCMHKTTCEVWEP